MWTKILFTHPNNVSPTYAHHICMWSRTGPFTDNCNCTITRLRQSKHSKYPAMLTIIIPLLFMLALTWVVPGKRLWEVITANSLMVTGLSLIWFYDSGTPQFINIYFSIDKISAPLLILTTWLTGPTLIASQNKLSLEPISRQRTFIFTILLLQTTTLLAFIADNLILFFIIFESTVIPTLVVITRWGAQKERLLAGTYFIFYTLFGSMALLTAILFFHETFGTLSITLIKMSSLKITLSSTNTAWWAACFLAFLIKIPLFGLHLWLPKAHVEAPIAGSIILAGTLLKLGGYGIIRVSEIISDLFIPTATPLIVFSLFGVILAALLCARQTDIKSLIAYSSVSHIGLVIAAAMIKTDWSISGAILLIISHGLVSSALFCLANKSYERVFTRTLILLQGTQIIFPLAAAWWLLAALINIALPPSPNFIGEIFILTSLFQWSNPTLIICALGIIFTTIYSLYLFWSAQREYLSPHTKSMFPSHSREHLLFALHIVPTILLILKPDLIF